MKSENSVPLTALTSAELAVEPFINKRVVARRMGRTIRSVDSLMKRGIIPFYKLGPSVLFRWSEIQSQLSQTCRVCRDAGGTAS